MKEIQLTQGQVAFVDDEDFDRVNQYKWSAQKAVSKQGVSYYAFRTEWLDWKAKKQRRVMLHRFILDAPDGVLVDHKNRNPLDCRKENLRLATHSQNGANRGAWSNTGYKGVYFIANPSRRRQYLAQIKKDGETITLGKHLTAEDAARIYDKKAVELYGEFAALNFPEEKEKGLTE